MDAGPKPNYFGLPGLLLLLGGLNLGGIASTTLFALITSAAVMTGIN